MLGEVIGIGGLLREHHIHRIRVLKVGDLCVECVVGGLRVIFARHHLVAHVLRDGEDLGGGQTHIQVVAADAILHILQGRGGGDVHFLIIRQHGGAGGNVLLPLLAEDGGQHFQHGDLLGLIFLHLFGDGQLAHGIGQQPVVLLGLAEIGQDDAVDPPLLRDVVRQSRRVADHSGLFPEIRFHRDGKLQLLVTGLEPDIL